MPKQRIYIVCGAAGCGKTTLVNAITKARTDFVRAKKFSTRTHRGEGDDIIQVSHAKIDRGKFDLAYEAAGNKYAFHFDDIESELKAKRNVIFPLTDIGATKRIAEVYGNRAISICVMSALNTENFLKIHSDRYGYDPTPNVQNYLRTNFDKLYSASKLEQWQDVFQMTKDLLDKWEDSIPNRKDLKIRIGRVQEFQARYFENLAYFDYTILNYRDGHKEDMFQQFEAIVKRVQGPKKCKTKAPLFVVSGSSGSGKGMLATTLGSMAPHEVQIVEKEGKREPKPSDKRDGMSAIGEDGVFCAENDFVFESHKAGTFAGTEYAFSTRTIRKNLADDIPQCLVANILTNPILRQRLLKEFGDRVVFLYLWRLQNEDEMVLYQKDNCATIEEANARIEETLNIYKAFCADPSTVDHVLLNTGFPEGLSSQFFHLLQFYRQIGAT